MKESPLIGVTEMTAKEAYEIIKQQRLDMKLLECVEMNDFFAFGFVPLDFDEENEGFGGGLDTVNKKTGKTGSFNPVEDLDSFISAPRIAVKSLI